MKTKTSEQECESDLTMSELNWVIAATRSGKAAGEDNIAYEFIKHLGPKARAGLLNLFNRFWRGEGIPTKWLIAIIRPLLKWKKG